MQAFPSPLFLSPLFPFHQGGELLPDAAEAEIVKQCQRGLQVDLAHPAGVPIDSDRNVGVEADQVAAQQGLIAKLPQVFLAFCPGHVAGMVEDRLQGAILFEQLPGELGPDQRHARHVIDRIAHQGLKIDHLVRRDSPFRAEGIAVENVVLADVEDVHAIGDQLSAVLVAGHQKAVAAQFIGQPGDGRQHIVRLVRRAAEGGDAQRGDGAADGRDLRHQVLVHLHPPDLVLGHTWRGEKSCRAGRTRRRDNPASSVRVGTARRA